MSPSRATAHRGGNTEQRVGNTAHRLGSSATLAPRGTRLLRAGVLVVIGLVVTFSVDLHENPVFDIAVIVAGLALIGVADLVDWFQRRGTRGAPVSLLLGLLAFGGGAAAAALYGTVPFAIVVAGWAVANAVLEFIGMTLAPGGRQDAALIGAAGLLLALLLLLFREDMMSVIGFFGGYAVLAGVFLGIGAFDGRRQRRAGAQSDDTPVHHVGSA